VGTTSEGDGLCPSASAPSARRLIEATCRDVRDELATVPGATLRLETGSFVDSRLGCTREGCVVRLAGSFRALEEQASPDSWLSDYLVARGWSRLLSRDADGPDGTTYALHQPGALCIVQGRWNHWHAFGGEGLTDDAYELTVSCGGAELTPPDPQE